MTIFISFLAKRFYPQRYDASSRARDARYYSIKIKIYIYYNRKHGWKSIVFFDCSHLFCIFLVIFTSQKQKFTKTLHVYNDKNSPSIFRRTIFIVFQQSRSVFVLFLFSQHQRLCTDNKEINQNPRQDHRSVIQQHKQPSFS